MTIDQIATAMFIAGVLAGIGVTVVASLIPDLPKVFRDYRAYFRAKRRRP